MQAAAAAARRDPPVQPGSSNTAPASAPLPPKVVKPNLGLLGAGSGFNPLAPLPGAAASGKGPRKAPVAASALASFAAASGFKGSVNPPPPHHQLPPGMATQAATVEKAAAAQQQQQHQAGVVLLFHEHIKALLHPDSDQRERGMVNLEKALFDQIGAHTFAASLLRDMQLVVTNDVISKIPSSVAPSLFKLWVPIFFLGSNVNSLVRLAETIHRGESRNDDCDDEHSDDGIGSKLDKLLTLACERANTMVEKLSEIASTALKRSPSGAAVSGMLMPFSAIPIVLKRHRDTFDTALQLRGLTGINANSQAPSLLRHLRMAAPQPLDAPPTTLTAEMTACAMVAVICENCASRNMLSEFIFRYSESFLKHCRHLALPCSTLLYRLGAANISNHTSKEKFAQSFDYFAQSLDLCPEDHLSNRRLIFDSLCMCGIALAKLPDDDTLQQFGAEDELLDLIRAVRCANLELFEVAVRNNLVFYIERGLAGVLHTIRSNILAGMVMKYYDEVQSKNPHQQNNRLDVGSMLVHYRWNGLEVDEACALWLLPLLLQPRIKGAIHSGGTLLLNPKQPFYEITDAALLPA